MSKVKLLIGSAFVSGVCLSGAATAQTLKLKPMQSVGSVKSEMRTLSLLMAVCKLALHLTSISPPPRGTTI